MRLVALALTLLITNAMAARIVIGTKSPNSGEAFEKNLSPMESKALVADEADLIGGFNYWVDSMVATPNQENAGSCLFMSHTASVEAILNQKEGYRKYDLSERYFMNLSKANIGDNLIDNWITDTIYRLNVEQKVYTNEVYPYKKDWYKIVGGTRVDAEPEEEGAYYGIKANWVVNLDQLTHAPAIKTPKFKRDILFEDGNRWNVGTAPSDIVETVKKALETKKGPVVVIYNHTGFWHAVMVGGYNDTITNHGCPFVSEFPHKMNARALEIREEAAAQTDESERARLERKARLFEKRGKQVEDSFNAAGGCSNQGAFYVRDSIYSDPTQPLYDYDPNRTGEERHLGPRVILREYEWLRHMANHVMQIYVAQ